jgi:DNA-binding response OmpR family regulator
MMSEQNITLIRPRRSGEKSARVAARSVAAKSSVVPRELHVLLVEDSELTLEHLTESIRSIDYPIELAIAKGEQEALALIAERLPNIVLLDLMLKDGHGFSVLRALNQHRPKPFVIVLTNHASPQYREYALMMGADYFLDKAVAMDSVHALVELHAAGFSEGPE